MLKGIGSVKPPGRGDHKGLRVEIMEAKCESVQTVLEDYCEKRLDRQAQTAVEQHLHYCEECILRWALIRVETDDRLCNV